MSDRTDPTRLVPSKSAEQLAMEFEAAGPVPLEAYDDPLKSGLWTIGYGHTGIDVYPGLTITQDAALVFLRRDLSIAGQCVSRFIQVPLTQNEFDALAVFILNVGCGNFFNSTMRKLINHGEIQAASLEFEKWDHAGGREVAGLLRRRKAEENLFDAV